MMEMDMWNEDILGDWGQTAHPSRGLFGDHKSVGCLYGNDSISLQLQDAVELVRSESPTKNEDMLGMEWMESSDLGSFLEVLGNDKLLPLEARLIEYTYSIAPEDPVTFDETTHDLEVKAFNSTDYSHDLEVKPFNFTDYSHDLEVKPFNSTDYSHDLDVKPFNSTDYSSFETFFKSLPTHGQAQVDKAVADSFMSPPSSPEQVAPIIKIEPVTKTQSGQSVNFLQGASPPDQSIDLFQNASPDFFTEIIDSDEQGVILSGLGFASVDVIGDTFVSFQDGSEFLGSPLSADDVESMLSSSTPNSPSESRNVIESSPELYKVILTSSIEGSKSCSPYARPKEASPYARPKASKQSKVTCRRPPAEPVPDYIIGEQLNKKDRKKLQNKNAAIRYRMKKKEEAVGIKSEEQILEDINVELRTKVEDIQREIKYMKNLMEDVCRAKGLM